MALMTWREDQKNNPSLTDHYLMQIAREVFCAEIASDKCADIKISDFKLKFGTTEEQPQELTEEEFQMKTEMAKGAWLARIGFNPSTVQLKD